MISLIGLALYLVFAALFFYALYLVVHRAVLNALRAHTEEQRTSTAPGRAGPAG